MNALVVDDDALTRRVEAALLKRQGFETKAAKNGQEAVDMFVAGKSFDLVLMDMEMPVMDGPTATRTLREMGVRCLIVGVTASDDQAKKEEFTAAGLDLCLNKPLNAQGVAAILGELDNK